jgi:hypothetical protein
MQRMAAITRSNSLITPIRRGASPRSEQDTRVEIAARRRAATRCRAPAVDEVLAAGWRFEDPPFDHELLIPMQKVVGSVSVQIAAF